jgi:hypothetical protein
MNQLGVIRSCVVFLVASITFQTALAQQIYKSPSLIQKGKDALTKEKEQGGNLGLTLIDIRKNKYRSAENPLAIRRVDAGFKNTQLGISNLQKSASGIGFGTELGQLNINVPDFQRFIPNISTDRIIRIIDRKALQSFLQAQLVNYNGLETQFQPHLSAIETLINQNFNSIVDLPRLSQVLFAYIEENNLLQQIEQAGGNIDWSGISPEDFINEQQLQILLDELNENFNGAYTIAEDFINGTQTQLNSALNTTYDGALSSIRQNGFTIQQGKLTFTDPSNPANWCSFSANLSNSNASCSFDTTSTSAQANFVANAGNYIYIDGEVHFSADPVINGAQNMVHDAVTQITQLVNQGVTGSMSVEQLISGLENIVHGFNEQDLQQLQQQLIQGLGYNVSLTVNFEALSDSFQGGGSYQIIDMMLESLAHDVGSVTFTTKHIVDIVNMLAKGGGESDIGQYILEDVAGYSVDIITYRVARDVANTFLSEHFAGNIIALQRSFGDNKGGLVVSNNNSLLASVEILKWKNRKLIATGSYNQLSVNNTPLLNDTGHLHLRTELRSDSVGVVYLIPKLLANDNESIMLSGFVQVEALFVRAKSASLLTKTTLLNPGREDVVSLYDVDLSSIEGATDTYVVPMVSFGLNLMVRIMKSVTGHLTVVGFPIAKQEASLEDPINAVTLGVQAIAGFDISLGRQKTRAEILKEKLAAAEKRQQDYAEKHADIIKH